MAVSPSASDAHHGYQGREEHGSHRGKKWDKGDASPESERPSVTRDASSSPFAELELELELELVSKCALLPETADASMQTDEQFRVVAAPPVPASAAPSVVAPPPPMPPTTQPTAQPTVQPHPSNQQPHKRKDPEKNSTSPTAPHAPPTTTTTTHFSFSPTMLLVVVGGAVLLTASVVLVAVVVSSRLTSPRPGPGLPQQQQQQQQQRAQPGAAGQASSRSLSQQSTLWLLPDTSVILSPTSPSRFYDATTMTFASPPIPSHLPIAKEIGQGVRQWWYEWRWEWHLSAGAGASQGACYVEAMVSSSAKTPVFRLQHREDIADGGVGTGVFAPAATEPSEPLSFSSSSSSSSSPSSSSPQQSSLCLSEDFPSDASSPAAVGATASAAPPPLAAWNGTEAALRQLPSLSGTYVAFLRLYKIRHAGGEGSISIPTAAQSGSSGSSDKQAGAHTDQARFSLLQSIRLSSQPVEMVVPPRTKTKPGYFFKKAGDRLDLVVSASGNPLPEYTWFKNGFLLQRSKEERERPHLLVIDRLSKVQNSQLTTHK